MESGFPVSLLGWANSNMPPSKLATSASCLSPGMNKTELQGSSCKKTHKQKYPLLGRLSPLAKRPSRHLLISLKGIHQSSPLLFSCVFQCLQNKCHVFLALEQHSCRGLKGALYVVMWWANGESFNPFPPFLMVQIESSFKGDFLFPFFSPFGFREYVPNIFLLCLVYVEFCGFNTFFHAYCSVTFYCFLTLTSYSLQVVYRSS